MLTQLMEKRGGPKQGVQLVPNLKEDPDLKKTGGKKDTGTAEKKNRQTHFGKRKNLSTAREEDRPR